MKAAGTLVVIDAPPGPRGPGFNACLIVASGHVVEAAPILRWTRGKPFDEVIAYARRRGWTLTPRS